jgi:hypothetical protein
MRAIWSYISREFCSNSATASRSRDFLALATYSSVSPSTILTFARALFQMEVVGHDFFLFFGKEPGRPSVVYRRRAYDYGVIALAS